MQRVSWGMHIPVGERVGLGMGMLGGKYSALGQVGGGFDGGSGWSFEFVEGGEKRQGGLSSG